MGLTTALSSALSGLQASTYGLSVVSSNVANADTPGYARRKVLIEPGASSQGASGVRVTEVARQVDVFVERQLRTERSSSGFATTVAGYYGRLDGLYGTPGGATAIDTLVNAASAALRSLATTPESATTRAEALNASAALANQLNALSGDVQTLRTDTEEAIGAAVSRANTLLETIAKSDQQIIAGTAHGSVDLSSLIDQRNGALDELSRIMDVRATFDASGGVQIATNSGVALYNGRVATLGFDAQTPVRAEDRYSTDPAVRGVGTVFLTAPDGSRLDMLAMGAIRSGEIAGLVEMRDRVLPGAQAQLDDIASQLADSMSRRDVAGTAVSSGGADGFDVDLTGMQPGNIATLTYTDAGGATKTVSFVRVDDPSVLPLSDAHTASTKDRVVGIDFSGGPASVAAQVQAALGASFQVSNPGGNTLRILDDGAAGQIAITGLKAGITETSLQGGSGALPLFIDTGRIPSTYSRAIDASGDQKVGFAGRIAINPALTADPGLLVAYRASPAVASGDSTRPSFLADRFDTDRASFASDAGTGLARPFTGTLSGFTRQVLDSQANAASRAQSLKTGQDVVVDLLEKKNAEVSGVNIDQEMADLLSLQQAYSANARVMTAVKEMIDMLLRV